MNPAVYPTNAQFSLHFREFLTGYRSSAESIEVKFPKAQANRNIAPFSVGLVDGFLKVLTMMGFISIIDALATWMQVDHDIHPFLAHPPCSHPPVSIFWPSLFGPSSFGSQELTDEDIQNCGLDQTLASFALIRCSFTYFKDPSHYHLHALRFFQQRYEHMITNWTSWTYGSITGELSFNVM